MKRWRRTAMRWLSALCLLLAVGAATWYFLPQPRVAVYSLYRERGKSDTIAKLHGYSNRTSAHFSVWYTEADAKNVSMVLATAEQAYTPVTDGIGYRPVELVPIIIYPTRNDLRQAFGWSNNESAMGVYWAGTIRLLSPNVWANAKNDAAVAKVFARLNPIAHEFTHLCFDYYTSGNYPRWFTEGLAQRVEYQVSGYLWLEESSSLRQDLYALDDLQNHFDQLDNQPLAYRQSYLVVDYMVKTYGQEKFNALLRSLSKGLAFPNAVEQTYGRTTAQLYGDWQLWLPSHLDQLDPA